MTFLQILVITTLVTNIIVLILLFTLYQSQRMFLDIRPFIKHITKLRNQVTKKEEKVLEGALDESESSVKETLEGLKEVEELTEATKRSLEAKAERLVEESVSKQSEVFQKVMKDITDSYKKELGELGSLQIQQSKSVVDSVKRSADEQIRSLREEILRITEEEKKKVKEEMQTYKDKLKAGLNQNIFSIISEVARETIGESIDTVKHEELVLKALEKAKSEKLF